MDSLSELNKICQKPDYRKKGNWMVRTFLRDAALPCTWLLLHTPVTADQVTFFALLTGLLGCLFLALPGTGCFLGAVFLLQLWYYLDHVDGQIARYRKTSCLTGRFFDFLMHHLIHAAAVLGLGLAFSQTAKLGTPGCFLAVLVSFFMTFFNLLHDIKSKAFVEKLQQSEAAVITPRTNAEQKNTGMSASEPAPLAKRLFSFLHKSCEIHVLMNVLTAFALAELLVFKDGLRIISYLYYGPVIIVITILKFTYVISRRKIDEEFQNTFTLIPDQSKRETT